MKPKKTLNLAVPQELHKEFNAACATYGHGKQKGMVLSAAILMFLRATPQQQGAYLHEIMAADIADSVKNMQAENLAVAKHAAQEKLKKQKLPSENLSLSPNAPQAIPRKAAKLSSQAKRDLK